MQANKRVIIGKDTVAMLLGLKNKSICVAAAFETRMSGLITTDLDFEMAGVGSSLIMERIIEERLVPLCSIAALHISAMGVVPVRLVDTRVKVSDDPDRKKRYKAAQEDYALDVVPVIPHYTTYEWYVYIDGNGELVNEFRSLIDDQPVYAIKSITTAGGQLDGTVVSEMAMLLREWAALEELRLVNQSSVITQACPGVFVEHKHQTIYSTEAQDRLANTADDLVDAEQKDPEKKTLYIAGDIGTAIKLTRPKPAVEIIQSVKAGKYLDIMDCVIQLPDEWTVSAQPTLIPIDISSYEAAFEANVLSIFKVPPSFANSAKTGTSSIDDTQKSQQSENDRHQFKSGVDIMQRDLVHFFKEVYAIITQSQIDVKLPTVTFSTLEELKQLYGMNVIGAAHFRDFAARHQGIHTDYVVHAPFDLKIKQLEWVPPQKKTKT